MLYPIILQSVSDGYVCAIPDIAGCFSAGDTLEDAFNNAKEAIKGHLALLVQDGEEVPLPTSLANYQSDPDYSGDDFIFSMLDVDITHLLGKSEKINITVPRHLLYKIDQFVSTHPEYKNRSSFLSRVAADKVYGLATA
ncbi:type II toxin-antitoxin system HicB family antitoxin [Lonepinella sp. BR2919]|uniref:type II toxin-antitoxin system HicB family antitoxin n=1 Tax=unclassified Lonepinella TaxID=2642006 RepID=UPI003F6DD833